MGRLFGEVPRIATCASLGKLAVLYDGTREICRAVVTGLLRYDNSDTLERLNLHDSDVRARFPDLRVEDLLYELHVIDDRGRVYRGARAVNRILRYQRGLRGLLAYLWYFPGYAWLADRQYRAIAGGRYRFDPAAASPARRA